jgi:hypothetical protein
MPLTSSLPANMLRSLGVLCSAIVLAIGYPVSLCLGSEQLALAARLDASEYVVGQPIMLLVGATNVGQVPIEDVGPLEPSHGRLKLELFRAGEREPLPDYGDLITLYFSKEGLTLRPGEENCEMVDLIDHFGSWPPQIDWLGPVLWQRSLQPGEYYLQCSFRAHTGVRKGLAPLLVHSNALTFRVLPESAALPHLQKLDRLKRSSVWQERNRQLARLGSFPSQSMERRVADSWRLRLEQGLYFHKRR